MSTAAIKAVNAGRNQISASRRVFQGRSQMQVSMLCFRQAHVNYPIVANAERLSQ